MNGNSTRGAATRARIIRVAADLFHKQGVGATSPDQVIEASGTGKGQFYHYFKSKEGLVHEVLKTYLDDITRGAAPISYEIDSWEIWNMTRGCPFGTIGNEVTENDELIRQDLSLIFEVVKNKLAAFFIKEKARGQLSEDANEEQLADFCIATIQGAMLLGKIKRNSQPVESTVREAMAHLKNHAVASQS